MHNCIQLVRGDTRLDMRRGQVQYFSSILQVGLCQKRVSSVETYAYPTNYPHFLYLFWSQYLWLSGLACAFRRGVTFATDRTGEFGSMRSLDDREAQLTFWTIRVVGTGDVRRHLPLR